MNGLPQLKTIAQYADNTEMKTAPDYIRAEFGGSLSWDYCKSLLLGRAFLYGVAALGKYGSDHVAELLMDDLKNNMVQLGVSSFSELNDVKNNYHS